MDRLDELSQNVCKANKALEDEAKPLLQEAFTKILEKYPVVRVFSWKQYAPSFNDGDPCYFSVNGIEINYEDGDDDDDWNDDEDEDSEDMNLRKEFQNLSYEEQSKIRNEINSVVNKIPDDIMERLFGESSKVIVTRSGISVEDYYCGY